MPDYEKFKVMVNNKERWLCVSCKEKKKRKCFDPTDKMDHPICSDCNLVAYMPQIEELIKIVSVMDLNEKDQAEAFEHILNEIDTLT